MKPQKKVLFIERVSKSMLGLDGLQIVVKADRNRGESVEAEEINFVQIGKKCLNEITGQTIIDKYNIQQGIELKERLHQERVNWMKNQ